MSRYLWAGTLPVNGARSALRRSGIHPLMVFLSVLLGLALPHIVYTQAGAHDANDSSNPLNQVWKAGTTTMNAFIEPQWTVSHDGDGLPRFAMFAGLNVMFAKK